jgi:hypothetical protein
MFISRFAATLTASSILAMPFITIQPATAETLLGGLNLQAECARMIRSNEDRALHVVPKSIQASASNPKDSYSWRCLAADDRDNRSGGDYMRYQLEFNLNNTCKLQYVSAKAYARDLDRKNAYSWRCFQ